MALIDGVGLNPDNLKSPPKLTSPSPVISFFKSIFLILFFSAFVFTAVNLPAYYQVLKFRIRPQSVAIANPVAVGQGKAGEQVENNTLVIPKIGIKAPIKWDVSSENILESLQNGLVHIKGTGHPNDGKNIFITGHSSNYWWKEGGYNTVLALLPKLESGDEIFIAYNGRIERFIVSQKEEVSKRVVGEFLLADEKQLTIMTCVPVGTNLGRLLVIAKPAN